jgi:sulfur relay (sulfurtransferase) complex TusBCD TusD component (DsrE family)
MQGNQLCILIRQAPYTTIGAAEAVRYAGGAVGDGLDVNLLLVDDGVCLARAEQDPGATAFLSLSAALQKVMDRGVKVSALDASAELHGLLKRERLLPGVRVVDGAEVARQLAEASAVMVY